MLGSTDSAKDGQKWSFHSRHQLRRQSVQIHAQQQVPIAAGRFTVVLNSYLHSSPSNILDGQFRKPKLLSVLQDFMYYGERLGLTTAKDHCDVKASAKNRDGCLLEVFVSKDGGWIMRLV